MSKIEKVACFETEEILWCFSPKISVYADDFIGFMMQLHEFKEVFYVVSPTGDFEEEV